MKLNIEYMSTTINLTFKLTFIINNFS